jgi:hypothetical protein
LQQGLQFFQIWNDFIFVGYFQFMPTLVQRILPFQVYFLISAAFRRSVAEVECKRARRGGDEGVHIKFLSLLKCSLRSSPM